MSGILFRKLYLRLKSNIEEENRKRISRETPPKGVTRTEHTYVYDGEPLHKLNLYKPQTCADAANLPFIIDVHGGGWICGDKDTNNNFCSHLSVTGNVVAAPSYRTIDRIKLAEQIQDVFAFLRWAEKNSDEYGLNTRHVFLTGDSAGAQLALLAYCTNQNRELQKLFSVTPVNLYVKGLILNHGVCYLNEAATIPDKELLSRRFLIPGLLNMLYGENYSRSPLYNRTSEPSSYIDSDTVLPPILLITSQGDKFFSYQTLRLYHYLQSLGNDCELYFENDKEANHVFNVAYPDSDAGKKCNDNILRFIKDLTI